MAFGRIGSNSDESRIQYSKSSFPFSFSFYNSTDDSSVRPILQSSLATQWRYVPSVLSHSTMSWHKSSHTASGLQPNISNHPCTAMSFPGSTTEQPCVHVAHPTFHYTVSLKLRLKIAEGCVFCQCRQAPLYLAEKFLLSLT